MIERNQLRQQVIGSRESGVTLLLSILILAGMFIVTVTVSFFAIQELRAARSSSLSEPAIIAAETAGEQGIWLLKRGGVFADNCPADVSTQVNGTTDSGTTPSRVVTTRCVSYGAATFDLNPGEDLTFFLYDPADINGNLCMNQTYPACGGHALYSSITFDHESGAFAIDADAVTLDGQVFAGSSTTITPGNSGSIIIPDPIISSADERLRVTLNSSDFASVTVNTTSAIVGFGGMPDYPTVDAEGCSSLADVPDCNESREIFKRRINITVPR